jgi:hypothetical protein
LSFRNLNILNDDTTATKLGKKKKTLETTCCCRWDLGQNADFTYLSEKGKNRNLNLKYLKLYFKILFKKIKNKKTALLPQDSLSRLLFLSLFPFFPGLVFLFF